MSGWWAEFFKGYVLADAIYMVTLLVVIACLWRGQRDGLINLWDLVTSTDKASKVRTDARKMFEAGTFVVMTVGFSYLLLIGKMTEFYAAIYVGAFVTARIFRDREQRLNKLMEMTHGAKPEEGKP